MKPEELQVFIDSAKGFFEQNLGANQIQVGEPELQKSYKPVFYEYTGMINIFGDKVGCIYFSSPAELMKHLLKSMGESNIDDELIADLVGEIANSIAGNARAHYGSGFCLSIPTILKESEIKSVTVDNCQSYVIPLSWKNSRSSVAVWFE